jgi:hypothetical protein
VSASKRERTSERAGAGARGCEREYERVGGWESGSEDGEVEKWGRGTG